MAKARIDIGATVDFLTKGELDDSLSSYARQAQAIELEAARGIKYMRFPRIIGTVHSGTVGGSSTTTGNPGITAENWQPASSYAWIVKRVMVNGLFNSGSLIADTVGIYRNNPAGYAEWQLTASRPGEKFGIGEMVFLEGDQMWINNMPFPQAGGNTSGTLAATGNLVITSEGWQIPQEMLGKLA